MTHAYPLRTPATVLAGLFVVACGGTTRALRPGILASTPTCN